MITLEEIIDITEESTYHPTIARKKLMEHIDNSLDNRNRHEFEILTNILKQIKL
jgi:uncharacterized protein YpiB (UPF0302 family)